MSPSNSGRGQGLQVRDLRGKIADGNRPLQFAIRIGDKLDFYAVTGMGFSGCVEQKS